MVIKGDKMSDITPSFDNDELRVLELNITKDIELESTVFLDVISYVFEDEFLVVEYYEKYNDGVIMGKKKSYIPKGAINTCNVYESKDTCENHLNELFNKRMLENG